MPTRIRLVPDGPRPAQSTRRFSFNRPLAFGAAVVLWAAILVGLRLFAV